METFRDFVTGPSLLVHAAALFYVLGLMTRDQLRLRAFILAGSGFYALYYYFAVDAPLWDALFWSVLMAVVNITVMIRIVMDRTTLAMPAEQRDLYRRLDLLAPGEFRRLMRLSTWHTADGEHTLTREGTVPDALHYVTQGTIEIEKRGRRFSVPPQTFLGEIAFLLDQPASATTRVEKGGRYVSWKNEDLRQLERRHPALRSALERLVNRDLARKVASN